MSLVLGHDTYSALSESLLKLNRTFNFDVENMDKRSDKGDKSDSSCYSTPPEMHESECVFVQRSHHIERTQLYIELLKSTEKKKETEKLSVSPKNCQNLFNDKNLSTRENLSEFVSTVDNIPMKVEVLSILLFNLREKLEANEETVFRLREDLRQSSQDLRTVAAAMKMHNNNIRKTNILLEKNNEKLAQLETSLSQMRPLLQSIENQKCENDSWFNQIKGLFKSKKNKCKVE